MIKYAVYTKNRWRGELFDDLVKVIGYAGEIAVELGFEAADIDVTDSLQNKRRWLSLDRSKKLLKRPTLHLSAQSQAYLDRYFQANGLGEDEDRIWIEPGGDVNFFEAATGCSRKLGTVDALLRLILANYKPTEDVESFRPGAGSDRPFDWHPL
jgi:hypothetical protein